MKKNMNSKYREELTFGKPETYHIRIRGALEEHWSDYLGGMIITTSRQGEHILITNLIGQLVDQASLIEVLNTLYDMHFPIISVECLNKSQKPDISKDKQEC